MVASNPDLMLKTSQNVLKSIHCVFLALVVPRTRLSFVPRLNAQGDVMKKVALALVLVVAGLSLGGCFVGKGKAPAPIVTKG
jgi:hypothetical protein